MALSSNMKAVNFFFISYFSLANALYCYVSLGEEGKFQPFLCDGYYCITYTGYYLNAQGKSGTTSFYACETKIAGYEKEANFSCISVGTTKVKATAGNATVDGTMYCCNTDLCNTPSIIKKSNLYIWLTVGGIILGLIFIIPSAYIIVVRRIKKKEQMIYYHKIQKNKKIESVLSPLEAKIFNNERRKFQISSNNITVNFNKVLGKGSNATVLLAYLKGGHQVQSYNLPSTTNRKVAYKVSNNYSDGDEIEIFLRELDALIKLSSHPSIIKLFGWTINNQIPALITELADTNLIDHVKSFRGKKLPCKKMLSIILQISQALEYMAIFNMVHRDVACRNILLICPTTAKLADFGLCCRCDESFTYRTNFQNRFPLKWLSIEALTESDVWSFGIFCWEVFSYCEIPYSAMTNQEMLEFLQSGGRLKKPKKCMDEIYDIMLDCWKQDPNERPKFELVSKKLRKLLDAETKHYGYLNLDVKND